MRYVYEPEPSDIAKGDTALYCTKCDWYAAPRKGGKFKVHRRSCKCGGDARATGAFATPTTVKVRMACESCRTTWTAAA